jgi:hypothetical protein
MTNNHRQLLEAGWTVDHDGWWWPPNRFCGYGYTFKEAQRLWKLEQDKTKASE